MQKPLDFPDLLRRMDERAAAFRAVVAAAPDLDAPVPSCPGWTLLDLARHLGQGRRKWAAIVAAGPAAAPPPESAWPGTPLASADRGALLEWLAESMGALAGALREAGPDRGCWAWWDRSQSPLTTRSAARRQLHEVTVHTYDAQLAVGAPEPLPGDVALDGVEEFLTTCAATTTAWPHDPATVDFHAAEGRSWRLHLSARGARAEPGPGDHATASIQGTASELVLNLHGRITLDVLKLGGDRQVLDQLVAWQPE